MKQPVFKGSCTAIVTPFADGAVDYVSFEKLLDVQSENGTAAVVVCGTTGEAPTLAPHEHEGLIEFAVRHCRGRMKVIAGVGGNNTENVLKNAQNAKYAGADAILMSTPYYNKSTQTGLVKHFTYVADKVDIPMILYNVPSRTGIGISAQTYRTLSTHPNVNGIKEASGNITLVAETRYLCGEELNIWSGNDDNTVAMMAMGALGVISVASNIIPSAMAGICRLCLEGSFERAWELYAKYAGLVSALFCETNPIPVKAAMQMMGLCKNELRLPLVPISESNSDKLHNELIAAGIELK